MRLPKFLQRLACQYGRHDWKKPRRTHGFLRRSCSACPVAEWQDFPSGGWKTVERPKRVRRKKAETTPIVIRGPVVPSPGDVARSQP